MGNDERTDGASRRGVHYYMAFRECPRQFFYKHVLGLKAAEKRAPLVKGKALHAMQEFYLKGNSDEGLKEILLGLFEANMGAFFDESEAQEALETVWRAFVAWREALGRADLEAALKGFVKIECELELEGRLDDDHVLTGRIDRLYTFLKTPDDGVPLQGIDTKTSSSTGAQKICDNAYLGEQLPMYAMLVEQARGMRPAFSVDAVAFRKTSADVMRSPSLYFDSDLMEDARLSVLGTAMDIEDRLRGTDWLEADRPAVRLAWPRHTQKCSLWGCPYAEICRQVPRRGDPLVGMTWVDPSAADDDLEDNG